jgi:hypothetical protein
MLSHPWLSEPDDEEDVKQGPFVYFEKGEDESEEGEEEEDDDTEEDRR